MKGLFQMDQSQREKWERTRAKGMWHFVLLYGVLCWGGIMSLIFALYRPEMMKINIPIYLAGGLIFGLGCWFYAEYRYRKASGNTES